MSLLPAVWSVGPKVTWSIWLILFIWVWISLSIWVEAILLIGCLVILISVSGLLIVVLKVMRPKIPSSSFTKIKSENCSAFLVTSCLLSFDFIIIGFSSAVYEGVSISSAIWAVSSYVLSWIFIHMCRSGGRLIDLIYLLSSNKVVSALFCWSREWSLVLWSVLVFSTSFDLVV